MRKWTYLVAGLLICGTAATVTSCIDNEEPAGITDLRGAKAELLRAKSQVAAADAAYRLAETAWMQAQADYQAELAKQEAFKTQWHEAFTASEKQRIEQEMQISAEEFKAELLKKQQATAIAQAEYDKAIIAIEAALVGYKESVYAAELEKLLNDSYSIGYKVWNEVTSAWEEKTGNATGLLGISSKIYSGQNQLARMMREKAKLEFSYDISTKIAAVESQLAYETGVLEGYQKNLENLKVVAGAPYEEWNTKYQDLEETKKKLDAEKTNLSVAEKEALKPIAEKEKENDNAAAAKSELTFTIPAEIQDDFYQSIDENLSALDNFNFKDQASVDAEGNHSYPNGVTAMLTMGDKETLLDDLLGLIEEDYIYTDNELNQANVLLTQYKTIYDHNQAVYNEDLKAWKDALAAYESLYTTGNYHATTINDRDVIINKYEKYNALPDGTADDLAAKKVAQKGFAADLKIYLANRAKFDGFKIFKTNSTTDVIDPTVDADWNQWVAISDTKEQFGVDLNSEDAIPANGGAYKDYKEAAEKIGYPYATNPADGRRVEYTYKEYLENGWLSDTPEGTAYATFESREDYEQLKSAIDNKPSWDKLYADIKTIADANAKAQDDLNLLEASVAAEKEKVEAEFEAKSAAIEVELAGIQDIQDVITSVINSAAGTFGVPYEYALEYLKSQIAQLEGGSVDVSGSDYNFNAYGSISGQTLVIKSYEKLLAALKDGSYKPMEEASIAQKQAQIEAKQAEIDAWTVLFKTLNAKKDQLLKVLAGEGGETPAQ